MDLPFNSTDRYRDAPQMVPWRHAVILAFLVVIAAPLRAQVQTGDRTSGMDTWLELQAIPSMMIVSDPSNIPFAFEWEAAPGTCTHSG